MVEDIVQLCYTGEAVIVDIFDFDEYIYLYTGARVHHLESLIV